MEVTKKGKKNTGREQKRTNKFQMIISLNLPLSGPGGTKSRCAKLLQSYPIRQKAEFQLDRLETDFHARL